MGYYYTSEPENAVPGKSRAMPKTHTPGSRLEKRGLRYFNPEVGRWVSRDPIGEWGGLNLSSASANNLNSSIDPLGLDMSQADYSNSRRLSTKLPKSPSTSVADPIPGLPSGIPPLGQGECRIVLVCQPVVLGVSTPFSHCFLIFDNGSGTPTACRGGPGKGNQGTAKTPDNCKCCGVFGPIVTECGDYKTGFVDYERSGNVKRVVAQGVSVCEMMACAQSRMEINGNSCYVYDPLDGPNSNTIAADSLIKCGMPRDRLKLPSGVWAPGFDQDLSNKKQCWGK